MARSIGSSQEPARVSGVSNPEVMAALRGDTLEAFLATRNVPGAR